MLLLTIFTGRSKEWSLSEWVSNFLQDDNLYYDDALYDDFYDDNGGGLEDSEESEVRDTVLESVLIASVAMSLMFLVWWRQRMQQIRGEADEDARRDVRPVANNPALGQIEGFPAWAAGGFGI